MNFVGGVVWLEIFHFLGIAFWIGAVAMLNFRMIGLSKKVPVEAFHISTASFIGFGLTAVTGLMMYFPTAQLYNANPMFQLKAVLLVIAIVFGFVVQAKQVANAAAWSEGPPPNAVRLAGAISLLLWFGVLAAGRMITYGGFTQG